MSIHPSEIIERAALADLHQAATPAIREDLGLECIESGSTLVSVAGALPRSAIVINRCLGLGLQEPAAPHSVADIVDTYRSAGVARFFLQRHPDAGPPEFQGWMDNAGLTKARGWQKFSRKAGEAPTVQTDLRIAQVGQEFGVAFAEIVCDAFDLGDAAKPWLSLLPGRTGWHVFMSFSENDPAGVGALYVDNGIAWSDFGATAPSFRRRGSQGAILARRIEHAQSLGCSQVFTCTGEDVAGDPQHSYRNILKAGFVADYIRENYSPS